MQEYTEAEWRLILSRKEAVSNLNSARVRISILRGLPSSLRGLLWSYLSAAGTLSARFSAQVFPHLLQCKNEEVDDIIARDIDRTFPGSDMFREEGGYGQTALYNILRAYSVYDKELGYCQGMGFIAGLLLMEMSSEEEAFWTFVQVMQTYGWRNMFKYTPHRPNTPKLVSLLKSLDTQVRKRLPRLHLHLTREEMPISVPFTPYIMTIFSHGTPHIMAVRVMDVFLVEGEHVLFILLLRMLTLKEEVVLGLKGEVRSYIGSLHVHETNPRPRMLRWILHANPHDPSFATSPLPNLALTSLTMIDTSIAFSEVQGNNEDLAFDWGQEMKAVVGVMEEGKRMRWDFTEQKNVLRRLCRSIVAVHREGCILPDLNVVLEKIADAIDKIYTECRRVGAVSSKAKFDPPASNAISIRYGVQQLTLGFHMLNKLFSSLSLFLEKYQNEPVSLLNYVNMNRVSKAERLVSQAFEKMKELLQLSFAVRFQSLGQAFWCAVKIRRHLKKEKLEQSLDLPTEFEKPKSAQRQLPPQLQSPDDSFQQGLFTKTNEEATETLWPASPIGGLDVSLNTSIASVVAQIPKTIFTPAIALKPLRDIRI